MSKCNWLGLMILTLVAVSVSGCSSVDYSSKFNGLGVTPVPVRAVSHLNSRINGYYLFDAIPLFGGSVGRSDTFSMFTDVATLDNGLYQLTRKARAQGAEKIVDIHSDVRSDWMFFTLFVWCRQVQVSATAIQK